MRTLLLVEDNVSDEKLMLAALKKCSLTDAISVVRDGAEALDYLFTAGPHAGREPALPAVVLLDLGLPRIGGLQVLERLRADPRTRALPIVVLTSSDEPEDLSTCRALGANAFVRKPAEFGDLLHAVKTIVEFWMHLNEAPSKAI